MIATLHRPRYLGVCRKGRSRPGKGDRDYGRSAGDKGFVEKLRDFHGSLGHSEQAMLETIVQIAQGQDTGGYAARYNFSSQGGGLEDLVGWLEGQGEEDTQGFGIRISG